MKSAPTAPMTRVPPSSPNSVPEPLDCPDCPNCPTVTRPDPAMVTATDELSDKIDADPSVTVMPPPA